MKRIICLVLTISMLLSLSSIAFAAKEDHINTNGITFEDNREEIAMSNEEAKYYEKYNFDVASATPNGYSYAELSIVDLILSMCTQIDSTLVGKYNIDTYVSDSLCNYFYDCKEITNIELTSNKYLYIFYTTNHDEEVYLCYSESGLRDRVVYNVQTDSAAYTENGYTVRLLNLRYGVYYDVSDALIDEIYENIKVQNWENIKSFGMAINTNADGSIFIEPNIQSISSSYDWPTDESKLLSNLTSVFPQYTKVMKLSGSSWCSALSANVSYKVTETQNNYVKKTANWLPFAVGTTLTVIASALGGLPVITLANILSALGVAISAADTILQEVTMCKSAVYRYFSEKVGYIFDTTKYNQWVRVSEKGGTGEFTGGLDNNDKFGWLRSTLTPDYSYTYQQMANDALTLYNNDIKTYGVCKYFYPD